MKANRVSTGSEPQSNRVSTGSETPSDLGYCAGSQKSKSAMLEAKCRPQQQTSDFSGPPKVTFDFPTIISAGKIDWYFCLPKSREANTERLNPVG